MPLHRCSGAVMRWNKVARRLNHGFFSVIAAAGSRKGQI